MAAEHVYDGRPGLETAGHVLTCLSPSPSNAKVIRTAAHIAGAFQAELTALYVETPGAESMGDISRKRLQENIHLAEHLGAHIVTAYGDDVPMQIASYAEVSHADKIVVGLSNHSHKWLLRKPNLVEILTQLVPNLEVIIIPDETPLYRESGRAEREGKSLSWKNVGRTLGLLALASLIGLWFRHLGFSEATIITVYILSVLFTALYTDGRFFSIAASILSVLVFNYLFTEPRFTLIAYGIGYPVTFFVMFIAAFLTSSLTVQVKRQAQKSAQSAYRTEVLLNTSRYLQQAGDTDEMLRETAKQMIKLLNRTVLLYPVSESGLGQPLVFPALGTTGLSNEFYTDSNERAVAHWVWQNNTHAGATTKMWPDAKCLYFAIRGRDTIHAVAGIVMGKGAALDTFEKNLLLAMLGECGLALEKEKLSKAKNQLAIQAQQEQMRANLLRAISHDLRTPLTSISGNADMLMNRASLLDETQRLHLYTDIYDDSIWLINLVENLLSVTRIGRGTPDLHMKPELLGDVIEEALQHTRRESRQYVIRTVLEEDLLMARMDARLIVQVLINLIDNAIKYTPPGSHITISARREGGYIAVSVADDGEGIPDEAKKKLFNMFYTGGNARCDGRRGLGLGLSLCKSIIAAHGGTIDVFDNQPHGTVFRFTLAAQGADENE